MRGRFNETQAGEIDIIVSEIASNLVKHAGGGEILFRVYDPDKDSSVFEILSIDKGPGIADTARMMRDGVSTTHTLGHGLGAIHRLSDIAQLFSLPGWGTILYAMVSSNKRKKSDHKSEGLDIRGLCVSKPRETVCGDGYYIKRNGGTVSIFFGDGLGHGPHAREAVERAIEIFVDCNETEPIEIIRQMHENTRRTRGLVGTIAICNLKAGQWTMCGVGNILTRLYSGIEFKNYMPYNGTIGMNLPTSMNASTFVVENNQHLVMCSDGIQSRWDMNKFPAILKYDNIVLAAAIYKDYGRGTDDASVLIAKVV
jgi:hypothetical protein